MKEKIIDAAKELDLSVLDERQEFLEVTCSWSGDCENTSQK